MNLDLLPVVLAANLDFVGGLSPHLGMGSRSCVCVCVSQVVSISPVTQFFKVRWFPRSRLEFPG